MDPAVIVMRAGQFITQLEIFSPAAALAVFAVLALGLTSPPILYTSTHVFSSNRLDSPNASDYPGEYPDQVSQVRFDSCIHCIRRKKRVNPHIIMEISDKLIDEKNQ